MEDRDNIFIGIALGAIVPVLGFFVVQFVFDQLVSFGLMSEGGQGMLSRRTRMIALLAICCNLIPFNYAKRHRLDNMMRGIVFPTLIYVGYWLYMYRSVFSFVS